MSDDRPYKECPAPGCGGRGFQWGRDENRERYKRECPKCWGFGILIRAGEVWRAVLGLLR